MINEIHTLRRPEFVLATDASTGAVGLRGPLRAVLRHPRRATEVPQIGQRVAKNGKFWVVFGYIGTDFCEST